MRKGKAGKLGAYSRGNQLSSGLSFLSMDQLPATSGFSFPPQTQLYHGTSSSGVCGRWLSWRPQGHSVYSAAVWLFSLLCATELGGSHLKARCLGGYKEEPPPECIG